MAVRSGMVRLIGMGATVLNKAVIGNDSLVGACALVTEGKVVPGSVADRRQPGCGETRATTARGDSPGSAAAPMATSKRRRFRNGLKRVG